MRRTLIILVSVAVNLCFNAGTNAYVIAKAGAVAGSGFDHGVSGSNGGSYSGATAHAVAQASAASGSGFDSGLSGANYVANNEGVHAVKTSAASSNYDGSGSSAGAISATHHCSICRHQSFPGPNGSIHDYKPASSVPALPHGSVSAAHSSANAGSSYHHSAPPVISLPGAPVGIYNSKPLTTGQSALQSSGATNTNTAYVSNVQTTSHVSPSLIGSFPGPSGSIYDSKPASAIAGAAAIAGASTSSTSGSNYHMTQPHPQPTSVPIAEPVHPIVVPAPALAQPNPKLSQIIPVFPGQSGSIYSSKPVSGGSQHVKETASGSTSEYHDQSGSITNIPVHVNSGSSCRYVPGVVGGKCGGNDQINVNSSGYADVGSGTTIHAGATASAGSSSSSTSSTNYHVTQPYPQSVPALIPVNTVQPIAVPAQSSLLPNPQLSQIIPILPGQSGSIYSSKPVLAGSQHVTETGSGSSSEYHDQSGSITNIPDHVNSGSSCRYVPGVVGSKCGGNDQANVDNSGYANVESGAGATAVAGVSSSSGSNYHVAQPHPQLAPNSVPVHTIAAPALPSNSQQPHIIPVFPGQSGSIHNSNPILVESQHLNEAASHATSSGYHDESGSITNIPANPNSGSSCRYVPGLVGNKCGSNDQLNVDNNLNSDFGTGAAEADVSVPSVHPEIPLSGTYYINKPSVDLEAPVDGSKLSFTGQIPCSGSSCGSVNQGLNHDAAHLSGGIVFQNEDGSYHGNTTPKPTYKNAESGNYAVSSNSDDNKGVLIGPGTGHLPIENTHDAKPFGTQGAFGGSAAFSKNNAAASNTYNTDGQQLLTIKGHPNNQDKPFGTQGAFGGSEAFSKSSAAAGQQSSGVKEHQVTQGTHGGSGAYSKSGSVTSNEDKSTSYGGHGTFGASKADAVAFSKSGAVASNDVQSSAGHNHPLIDVRDQGAHGLSGSFSKSSSSAHSYSSASASAVSFAGTF